MNDEQLTNNIHIRIRSLAVMEKIIDAKNKGYSINSYINSCLEDYLLNKKEIDEPELKNLLKNVQKICEENKEISSELYVALTRFVEGINGKNPYAKILESEYSSQDGGSEN